MRRRKQKSFLASALLIAETLANMKATLLHIIIFTLFISGCTSRKIEPLPQHGLLWKITGNGLKNTSFLFGTYHNSEGMQILDSIKTFDSIFSSTNQLICEFQLTDFTNHLEKKKENDFKLLKPWPNPDSTYNNLLTNHQKIIFDSVINSTKLLKKLKKANLNLRPISFLNFIKLTEESKSNDGLTKIPILDSYLQNLAMERDMKVISLDSEKELKEINDSINNHLSQLDYRTEVDILIYYIKNKQRIDSLKQNYTNRLLTTYLNQDILSLEQKSEELNAHNNIILSFIGNKKLMQFQKEMLIDKRNNFWISKIPSLIKNNSSFIAVGASHLGGEKGLINQLRLLNYNLVTIK